MPTLIERLEAQSAGLPIGDLASTVAGQLGTAVELFRKLPDSPQESVQGLLQALGDVPVPELQVAGRVGSQLANLGSAMPTDFSSLTGAFDPILENLQGTLGGDLIPTVRRFLDLAKAIEALTHL